MGFRFFIVHYFNDYDCFVSTKAEVINYVAKNSFTAKESPIIEIVFVNADGSRDYYDLTYEQFVEFDEFND